MTEDVIKALNDKEKKDKGFHYALFTHARDLVAMSRSSMSKHYSDWDMQDEVFRGMRYLDSDDREQALKGTPTKMVVPNTFAQVMTFSSFLFLMFNQNNSFFDLIPTGSEDYGDKQRDSNQVISRDLRRNKWNVTLFQHLLDLGRFGPAVIECCWTKDTSRAYLESTPTVYNVHGVETEVRGGSEWREIVKYEGNLVRPVSPYRFFPDTRLPLVDFQKGEFCGAEEEYSMVRLRALERAGEVAGVDHIEPLGNNWKNVRGGDTRLTMTENSSTKFLTGPGGGQSKGTVIVTKVQVWLIPNKFEIEPGGKKLGPEEFPILYHVWYANDNQVIRCEPAYWWHNQFGWTVSQFTPDMNKTVNLGLADLIYRLQDVITWHINARITDVRRNLRGRNIVDPTGLDVSTLDGDGDIYLRKSAAKSGVDKWIKPLAVQDVTQSHMSDADTLSRIMEVVTGVNGNAMGQYNSGRRSAQEARVVTAGAAGRMKMHGHLIWEMGLGPLGQMMLSNSRQSLPKDEFKKVVGGPEEELEARYEQFRGTPEEVVGGDDYFMFDSTLSAEKGFMAQSLQELLSTIMQTDPTAAQRVGRGIDPTKIIEEIQYLRGSGNIKRFRYSPEEAQQIAQEQQRQMEIQNAPHPKPPSESLNYKDAPPDIQRQLEAAAGLQPSQMGEMKVSSGEGTNGNGSALHVDRSTHITVQKPGAKK